MHRSKDAVRTGRCLRNRLYGGILVGLLLVATSAHAVVTFDEQFRDVTAFTIITFSPGDNVFCTDETTSQDPGVFAETLECHVEEVGSQATALSGQLSYIFPHFFIAEGSIDAHADISDEVDFAEGIGSSRFTSEFSVDVTTEIHLSAMLYASGNGATNIVFRVRDGEIYIIRTIRDDFDEIDEWFNLDPGSYELTFATSGSGQALPDGSGNPAFGSFSGSIEFPTAAVVMPEELISSLAPVAVPNPLRNATMLFPTSGRDSRDSEILVLDPGGRLIRRFSGVGPAGVKWDTRDEQGRRVPAGIYLIRGSRGGTARAVVLR